MPLCLFFIGNPLKTHLRYSSLYTSQKIEMADGQAQIVTVHCQQNHVKSCKLSMGIRFLKARSNVLTQSPPEVFGPPRGSHSSTE